MHEHASNIVIQYLMYLLVHYVLDFCSTMEPRVQNFEPNEYK
jgi:hypothetical protein